MLFSQEYIVWQLRDNKVQSQAQVQPQPSPHSVTAIAHSKIKQSAPLQSHNVASDRQHYDIYIDPSSQQDFYPGLLSFLNSKGIKVGQYQPQQNYLPYDLILYESICPQQGRACALGAGRASVWSFLKIHLPAVVTA